VRARTVSFVLAAALVVLGAVAPIVAAPASAAPVDTIYSLVNQARAAVGLRGLLRNASMDAVAAAWANRMGADGTLVHNPDFSAQIPGGWNRAGENIAEGHPTPQAMFDGWMRSAGHRANILGDYTDIGIAFVSVNGRTWGVQDFGKYPGHVGPPPPQAAASPAPAPAPAPAPEAAPPPAPSAAPSVEPSPTPSAAPSAAPRRAPTSATAPARSSAPVGVAILGDGVFGALVASVVVAAAGVCLAVVFWRRRGRGSAH
jgi:hypothetical protein